MTVKTSIILAGAVLVTACASVTSVPAPLNQATILTCASWAGRHTLDERVTWKETASKLELRMDIDLNKQVDVAFPTSAFANDNGPRQTGEVLVTPNRIVYQSLAPSWIDTVTVTDLSSSAPKVVWQHFRLSDAGAKPTVLQGECTRT